MSDDYAKVLYISYNGINEPLVESQVLSYLRLLAEKGVSYKLITYERAKFQKPEESRIRSLLLKDNIEWHPFYTNTRFGGLSAAIDIYRAYSLAKKHSLNVQLIHARSFMPSLLGRLLKQRQNLLLLNDIRGFWVDEKVYKNSIKANGVIYRIAKRLEAWILLGSDYIVSLTDAGQHELSKFSCFDQKPLPPMVTIPTCVDTSKFSIKPVKLGGKIVIGYVGSMSSDYLPDEVFRFFALYKQFNTDTTLKLVTRSDQQKIRAIAKKYKVNTDDYLLVCAKPDEVPAYINSFDVALSFIKPGFSKRASCPTKVGEYLSSGIPVVSNSDIGDLDSILSCSGAGVVLKDFSTVSLNQAIEKIEVLRGDDVTTETCRKLAKDYFSLIKGVNKYFQVYGALKDSHLPVINKEVVK